MMNLNDTQIPMCIGEDVGFRFAIQLVRILFTLLFRKLLVCANAIMQTLTSIFLFFLVRRRRIFH